MSKIITFLITCYNEEKNILPIYSRLRTVVKKFSYSYEILFVDNHSTDNSFRKYQSLSTKDPHVKILIMSRNFGSPQPSIVAGLSYAQGDCVVILHGDIQDPPEIIPEFIQKWEKGYEIVYGIHSIRKGYNFFSNFLYQYFYYLLQKLSYIYIPLDAGDFCLIDKKVIPHLLEMKEYDYYLRGLRSYVGFKQVGVKYLREKRLHGHTNTNFFLNLWWAKTIIISFSVKPLEWISVIAFGLTIITFLFMILNIALVLLTKHNPTGIPTIVVLILFLGSIQMLGLGIIAEYLAKIFLEVKGRPKYIIEKTLNIKK